MVLPTCCACEDTQRLWAAAQGQADQLARNQPEHFVMGGDNDPNQETNWNYNSQERTEARKHMIQCVLEGMIKCI